MYILSSLCRTSWGTLLLLINETYKLLNNIFHDSFSEDEAGPPVELAELLHRCDAVNTNPDPGCNIVAGERQ